MEEGGDKMIYAVDHIPVEIFLVISYFFDAKNANNSCFQIYDFYLINNCFLFFV